MHKLTLVIGNKNYSSWSLRPWVLLKYFSIPFEEILVPLRQGNYKTELLKYSPTGKAPTLIHGAVKIWESLAICEYLADIFPELKMWPEKLEDRALARSISAEIHAGFSALRTQMPMNLRSFYPGKGRSEDVDNDIYRILEIWDGCRQKFKNDGPFLFGSFTIADAMFLPVVTRFKTYGVTLSGLSSDYSNTILNLSAYREWQEEGIKEPWIIKASEIYT